MICDLCEIGEYEKMVKHATHHDEKGEKISTFNRKLKENFHFLYKIL